MATKQRTPGREPFPMAPAVAYPLVGHGALCVLPIRNPLGRRLEMLPHDIP